MYLLFMTYQYVCYYHSTYLLHYHVCCCPCCIIVPQQDLEVLGMHEAHTGLGAVGKGSLGSSELYFLGPKAV